jgi:hypothetical protein
MSKAFKTNSDDPFEYEYNGKIITKPYIEEIDRLLNNGYSDNDPAIQKLVNKLSNIIYPDNSNKITMDLIYIIRGSLKKDSPDRTSMFIAMRKREIMIIAKAIPYYILNDKPLTDKMKLIINGFQEDGSFDITRINKDAYEALNFK